MVYQQMRILHKVPFSPQEIEHYRQQILNNLTQGMKSILDALPAMGFKLLKENLPHAKLISNAKEVKKSEPYPTQYLISLRKLWEDPAIRQTWARRNEAALPEK